MHLLTERFVFGGDDQGFLKEGIKTDLMYQWRLLSRQLSFIFCLHVDSLRS